jgi:hypothetical protein
MARRHRSGARAVQCVSPCQYLLARICTRTRTTICGAVLGRHGWPDHLRALSACAECATSMLSLTFAVGICLRVESQISHCCHLPVTSLCDDAKNRLPSSAVQSAAAACASAVLAGRQTCGAALAALKGAVATAAVQTTTRDCCRAVKLSDTSCKTTSFDTRFQGRRCVLVGVVRAVLSRDPQLCAHRSGACVQRARNRRVNNTTHHPRAMVCVDGGALLVLVRLVG